MEKYSKIILDNSYLQLLIYYIVISIIGFFAMGKDKLAAKKGRWRIKEKTLFFISLIGGFIGCLIGMKIFRHKTQKIMFHLVFWGSLLIHTGIFYYLIFV